MKKNVPNQKHLTPENRAFIESSLNNNHSVKEIAYFLSKDASTISKEIKRSQVYKEPSKFGGYSNICIHRYNCTQHSVCGDNTCINQCYHCKKCNSTCTLFQPEICKVLNRAPHVCNGCKRKASCRLEKYYYRSKDAQSKYEHLRTSSREGINLSEYELKELNGLTVPLIKKGQPISHIFAKHQEEIPCTSRTFYSYVEKGFLSLSNIDLRRKVRYKKIKSKKTPILRRNSKLLIGRKYSDFINFISSNPDSKVVEMDLVEGIKGGIEKNHEYIRYVVPKGKSFDNFSQEDINLLMNHMNNTARENLNNHTPMELTKLLFSSKSIELLGLKTISPNEVCLNSKLFSLKY